jgi:hypothetical protein
MKMKTHEVAQILISLARALRRGPNVSLEGLANLETLRGGNPKAPDLPVALSALVALSKFSKSQWEAVIKEYRLPISVRPTESTRDIVGKILRHLEQDAEARRRLRTAAQRSRSDISPELMNALDFILK